MAWSVSCSPFSAWGQCVIIEDIGASNIYTLPTNVFLHYPCVMPVWPLYYHSGNNGRAWQNILASDYKRAGQPFNHHSLTERALFLLLLPICNVWLFSSVQFQALFPFKLPQAPLQCMTTVHFQALFLLLRTSTTQQAPNFRLNHMGALQSSSRSVHIWGGGASNLGNPIKGNIKVRQFETVLLVCLWTEVNIKPQI